MADEIVIYYSRPRLVLVTLGSLMFVAVGHLLLSGRGIVPIIGWLNIGFFGICGVNALWRLVRRTPALIVSSAGIVDLTSVNALGLVPWSEIGDLRILSFRNQRFLGVFIDNPAAFIARFSTLKRMALQASLRMAGTPIAIPRVALAMNLEELESVIRARWPAERQPPSMSGRVQQ